MRKIIVRKQKSTIHVPKALPFLIWGLALAGTILWLYLIYYVLFIFKMPKNDPFIGLAWTSNIVRRLTYLTFSVSGIYILIKAGYTRATLYFALLFTYVSASSGYGWLLHNGTLPQNWSAVVGVLFTVQIVIMVRSAQEFPGRLTSANISIAYRHYPMKAFAPVLSWLMRGYRTWLIFLPLGLVVYYLTPVSMIFDAIGFCFGLAYLFAQLRTHNTMFKRPLYWMLWVGSLHLFWRLLLVSAQLFGLPISNLLNLSADIALNLSLLFAFVMSVYFSDLLDAKLILQKTVIFSVVVFLFTFVFGVAEHLFIHQLSHYFHLADVYVSSTFACIMGMFFHPLKEKLTHWMKHFDHKSGNEHVENRASETLSCA